MLFGFFQRVSSQDPPQPHRGFEKKTLGHASGPRAHRRALGVFLKSPQGFGGSGRRSPRKNPNNLYIFLDWNPNPNRSTLANYTEYDLER